MTVRALIVEDEPLARRRLRDLLSDVPWIECVGEASDGETAVTMIDALTPDLVFLDIEMPALSGLQVLERVRHDPAVIFTTAHDQHAVAAFELEALDYLLKPFERERFVAAVERARRVLEARDAPPTAERVRSALTDSAGPLKRVFVRDRGKIVLLTTADIERLDADGDYVAVQAGGRSYLVYLSLNEFEQRLDPGQFLRVHRAHIVNLDFVRHLIPYDGARLQLEMRDGTKVMVSRARSKDLRHLSL